MGAMVRRMAWESEPLPVPTTETAQGERIQLNLIELFLFCSTDYCYYESFHFCSGLDMWLIIDFSCLIDTVWVPIKKSSDSGTRDGVETLRFIFVCS